MPPKVRQQYMPRAVSGRHCSGQVINLGPGQAQLYQACEIAEHGAAHHIDDKRAEGATIPVDARPIYSMIVSITGSAVVIIAGVVPRA
jgi:hypothetical protein